MTIMGVAIHSILALVLAFSATTGQQLLRQKVAARMTEQSRAIADEVRSYMESAGKDNKGLFSAGPFTTLSLVPIPQATARMIRLRSDADGNGELDFNGPEDVIISWNPPAKTLKVGKNSYTSVSQFELRYFNGQGQRLIPPVGGWNIARDAWNGKVLRSIARVEVQVEMENQEAPTPEELVSHYVSTSNAGIAHPLNLMLAGLN